MDQIGTLTSEGGRFTFAYAPLGLVIRGAYPEWVLEAAAEVMADAERYAADGKISELETLVEFEEATEVDLDVAKFDHKARFEAVPQCLVTMGDGDFRWVSSVGRGDGDKPINRVHDMSLTRNNSFLQDEQSSDHA